jgi:hypothetical protein
MSMELLEVEIMMKISLEKCVVEIASILLSVMKKTAPMPKLAAVMVGFGRRRTDGVTVVATNRLKKKTEENDNFRPSLTFFSHPR